MKPWLHPAGLVWAGASVRAVRALYEWLARLRAAQAALPPGQAPQHNSDRVFNSQLAPHLTRGARAGHPLVRLMQLSQARPGRHRPIPGPLAESHGLVCEGSKAW